VNKPSLEDFIERRMAGDAPRRVAMQPRSFDFLAGIEPCMTSEQLEALKFLLAAQDRAVPAKCC
jgi:hypothetical protein